MVSETSVAMTFVNQSICLLQCQKTAAKMAVMLMSLDCY